MIDQEEILFTSLTSSWFQDPPLGMLSAKVAEKAPLHLHHGMSEIGVEKDCLGPEEGIISPNQNQYQFESLIKIREIR